MVLAQYLGGGGRRADEKLYPPLAEINSTKQPNTPCLPRWVCTETGGERVCVVWEARFADFAMTISEGAKWRASD